MTVLYIYFGGGLIVALRLGYHMIWRLDRFDWRYGTVWFEFFMTTLLWPLAILKPGIVIAPKFTNSGFGIDSVAQERELDRLRNHLPPCGVQIRFATNQDDASAHIFIFDREVVRQALISEATKFPLNLHGQRDDILRWINQASRAEDDVADVPAAWWKFMYLGAAILRSGHGIAYCGACGKETPAANLRVETFGALSHAFIACHCECGSRMLLVDC